MDVVPWCKKRHEEKTKTQVFSLWSHSKCQLVEKAKASFIEECVVSVCMWPQLSAGCRAAVPRAFKKKKKKVMLLRSLPPVLTCPCLSVLVFQLEKMPQSFHTGTLIWSSSPLSYWRDREKGSRIDGRTGQLVLKGLVVAWQRALEHPPPMFSRCHFIKPASPAGSDTLGLI